MPTSEEFKAYFDRVAPTWDTMRQDYYGVAVIDKAVAAGLDQPPADLLVDVGCGTGFLTAGLAPLARRVIGVDDSPGMLAVAQENMRALGRANVELQQGSVDALPLDTDQADA